AGRARAASEVGALCLPCRAAEHGTRGLGRCSSLVAPGLDDDVDAVPDTGWTGAAPERGARRAGVRPPQAPRFRGGAPRRLRPRARPGGPRRLQPGGNAGHGPRAALGAAARRPGGAERGASDCRHLAKARPAPGRSPCPPLPRAAGSDPPLLRWRGVARSPDHRRAGGRLHSVRRTAHRAPRRAGPGGPAPRVAPPLLLPALSSPFRRFPGTDRYLTNPALQAAVNCALALERPLLVKGEPGTGKTLLADAIATALGLPLLTWHVKSTTRAQDGLYVYDTVQRL